MSIRYLTGRAQAVKPRLYEELRAALAGPDEHPLLVLVPEQYTLQSERDIIGALDLEGSFRLQVLSPARLFSRVFAEAGRPEPVRVDERGRVMLMHAALKSLSRELGWYRGGQHRPGFAEMAAAQIRELKQAGYTPDRLNSLAESMVSGALKYKLADLALIWTAYEEKLAGRFMDGEDELFQALDRLNRAPFLAGCEVWAYGFELVSPTLANTLVALDAVARQVTLLLPLENDASARDFYAFEPVQRSFERMCRMAAERGVEWSREALKEAPEEKRARPDLDHLLREVNCFPGIPYLEKPKSLRLVMARNPQDEVMTAMGLIREMVRQRGWRYRDVAIACFRFPEYAGALERCARLYGVPVFLESRRPCDRNALAQYLLLALRLLAMNWQQEDMRLLLRTGYCDLTDGEIDRLMNYALEYGLTGRLWRQPLRRGGEELASEMETLRLAAVEPLLRLEERMTSANTLDDQLRALWTLLEELDAARKLEERQRAAMEMGQMEAANECAQVWNRVVGTLDQLHQLMAGPRVPLRDLMEMLRESLAAADIKPLPQSGDAVMAGSLSHLRTQPVRLLILLGCNEMRSGETGGLFQAAEREVLGREKGIWLAPDVMERGRLQDIDLSAALALARQYVVIIFSQSSAEGGALLPSTVIGRLRTIFPQLSVQGGISGEEALNRLKYGAPEAALTLLPAELSSGALSPAASQALPALNALPRWSDRLTGLRSALRHRVFSAELPRDLARRLYGGPRSVSVTRLEKYAACPFRHFVEYGLRPEKVEPFELKKQDEGGFYHEAMERFLGEVWPEMNGLTIDEAVSRMDDVAERLLAPMMDGPLSRDPVSLSHGRRLRQVARRAARTVAKHLSGSGFEPCALEVRFGEQEPSILLHTREGDLPMQGRIDRIDRWQAGDSVWLRIIDYKSGASELNLARLYFGLQLQLIVYLAAALEMGAYRPAGAFYFKVADPLIETDERDAGCVEAMRADELRLSGLFIDDREVLEAMSPDIAHTIQLTLKPDGTPRSSVRMLDESGFRLLIDHAVRAASRIAGEILRGATDIAPVRMSSFCACDRCDWRALCQQDPRLGGMPRTLPALAQSEVLERIRQEE